MTAQRDQFSSRLGFILVAAGSAVGLGNIWRFPFLVGDGGGAAFVMVYLVFSFLIGFPIMVAEIAIGRKSHRDPVGAFKVLGFPQWSFIGMLGVISGIIILSFYNVVAGWAFGYFLEMLEGHFDVGGQFSEFVKDWVRVGAYAIIFMATTAFIVSNGVSRGIERAAKVLMPALVLLITALTVYAMTLPNAMEGVRFYLVPDFSKLTPNVLYQGMGQAFFSLSLGMGALITLGSYTSHKDNIIGAAAAITLADVGIAFIAGLMMFPFVFSQHLPPTGGAGLIFATLPGVFGALPGILGVVVGALFFLLLSFAALTSTVSLMEVPASYLVDERGMNRKVAVWGLAAFIFVLGIPSLLGNGALDVFTRFITLPGHEEPTSFMDLMGFIASDTFLPLGGFLVAWFTIRVWKRHNFDTEMTTGDEIARGSWLQTYINFSITYIIPVVLATMVIITILDRFFGISIMG